MENKHFTEWCFCATQKIRYGPDKKIVKKELMSHLEDAYEVHLLNGLSPAEAEQKVLAAMGSAEEIAPQLAQAHKPALGYIYSFTKAAAVIAVVFALYIWIVSVGGGLHSLISSRFFDSVPANHEDLDYYCQPDASYRSDGYFFRVSEAGYNKAESELYFQMDILCWPWKDLPNTMNHFWAVDSLGNYYAPMDEAYFTDLPRVSSSGSMSSQWVHLQSMVILEFDCDAQWVELHYDRDGRDVVLRIDLTGGGENE